MPKGGKGKTDTATAPAADQGFTDENFESTNSGASTTFPKQCSALRKGEHVVVKGHPCKIVEMSTSKTGKHGHAKVHMITLDIFTGRKYEEICPSTHNMDVPIAKTQTYTLIDIEGEFLSLMNDNGETKEDLKLPDEPNGSQLKMEYERAFEDDKQLIVTVMCAMGQEQAMSWKLAN